jgi:hypothetical protein
MPVDDSPLTRASLLVRLRDGTNHLAWQEFVTLYSPVVYGFARKRGLQDADAADLMQDASILRPPDGSTTIQPGNVSRLALHDHAARSSTIFRAVFVHRPGRFDDQPLDSQPDRNLPTADTWEMRRAARVHGHGANSKASFAKTCPGRSTSPESRVGSTERRSAHEHRIRLPQARRTAATARARSPTIDSRMH